MVHQPAEVEKWRQERHHFEDHKEETGPLPHELLDGLRQSSEVPVAAAVRLPNIPKFASAILEHGGFRSHAIFFAQ